MSLFATFVAFVEKPKDEKLNVVSSYGHGRYHRHRHRDGIYFRFDVGPRYDHYYYHRPYKEYVKINCEIYDTKYSSVKEVQIGRRVIYLNKAKDGRRYYFFLRPGYYTIRWRVSSNDYFGRKYKNYSRNFKVYRDREEIYITIKGSNISFR